MQSTSIPPIPLTIERLTENGEWSGREHFARWTGSALVTMQPLPPDVDERITSSLASGSAAEEWDDWRYMVRPESNRA